MENIKYSNLRKTIQGVHIKNARDYYLLKTITQAEHLEGWQPAAGDVQYVYSTAKTDNIEDDARIRFILDNPLSSNTGVPISQGTEWFDNTIDHTHHVLKNKLDITDAAKLADTEYKISAIEALRLLWLKPKIKEADDILKINKIIGGRLYDWAGKYRPVTISKGSFTFLEPEFFGSASRYIDKHLAKINKKAKPTRFDYAWLKDAINLFHPNRELNGRTCIITLECIALNHGQTLSFPQNNSKMIKAQNQDDINTIAKLIHIKKMPG